MTFKKPKKHPTFADLKGILAQTQLDNTTYQIIESLIDRLTQFQSLVMAEIEGIIQTAKNNGQGNGNGEGGGGPIGLHAPTHAAGGTDPVQIAQSQVNNLTADLANTAKLNAANTFTAGPQTIAGNTYKQLELRGSEHPNLTLNNTAHAADARKARVLYTSNNFRVDFVNDVESTVVGNGVLLFNRDTGLFSVTGPGTFGGNVNLPAQAFLNFAQGGVAPPSTGTRSLGTKLLLYPTILSGGQVDFAQGIESGAMWLSVPDSSNSFKWYHGAVLTADMVNGIFTMQGPNGRINTLPIIIGGNDPGGPGANGKAWIRGDGSTFVVYNGPKNGVTYINYDGGTSIQLYGLVNVANGNLVVTSGLLTANAGLRSNSTSEFYGTIVNYTSEHYQSASNHVRYHFRSLSAAAGSQTAALIQLTNGVFHIVRTDDAGTSPVGADWAYSLSFPIDGRVRIGQGGLQCDRIINSNALAYNSFNSYVEMYMQNVVQDVAFIGCLYTRVGNIITVSGGFDAAGTGVGAVAWFRMTLPINYVNGRGGGTLSSNEGEVGYISIPAGAYTFVEVQWKVVTTNRKAFRFMYQYQLA